MTLVPAGADTVHAQDLDRVILRNRNPVVGEIEELRRGTLRVDTDEMGVVGIDWNDIVFLTSSEIFDVIDVDGDSTSEAWGRRPYPYPGRYPPVRGGVWIGAPVCCWD